MSQLRRRALGAAVGLTLLGAAPAEKRITFHLTEVPMECRARGEEGFSNKLRHCEAIMPSQVPPF